MASGKSLPISQEQGTRAKLDQLFVMGDHNQRHSRVVHEIEEKIHHLSAGLGVQASAGLIGE